MTKSVAVTTRQPFGKIDDSWLFSVNAGIPNEDALERAADLMLYVETLAAAEAFVDKSHETGLIQFLSEMAKALMKATQFRLSEGRRSNA